MRMSTDYVKKFEVRATWLASSGPHIDRYLMEAARIVRAARSQALKYAVKVSEKPDLWLINIQQHVFAQRTCTMAEDAARLRVNWAVGRQTPPRPKWWPEAYSVTLHYSPLTPAEYEDLLPAAIAGQRRVFREVVLECVVGLGRGDVEGWTRLQSWCKAFANWRVADDNVLQKLVGDVQHWPADRKCMSRLVDALLKLDQSGSDSAE